MVSLKEMINLIISFFVLGNYIRLDASRKISDNTE